MIKSSLTYLSPTCSLKVPIDQVYLAREMLRIWFSSLRVTLLKYTLWDLFPCSVNGLLVAFPALGI